MKGRRPTGLLVCWTEMLRTSEPTFFSGQQTSRPVGQPPFSIPAAS
jgi:hypothetical protein